MNMIRRGPQEDAVPQRSLGHLSEPAAVSVTRIALDGRIDIGAKHLPIREDQLGF